MPPSPTCHSCGTAHPPGATQCPRCGASLAPAAPPRSTPAMPAGPEPSSDTLHHAAAWLSLQHALRVIGAAALAWGALHLLGALLVIPRLHPLYVPSVP
ncbi:MAG: hypothetical protein BWY76_00873 [bacterium ADurb.Bin429]|nr:MAG: hypothetical protein BWY76_00873 [bacterium ADurb.Bin429]